MPKDIQKELDEPVTIHFKEDSIPGVRRGVLTDESKAKLEALIAKEVKAARIDELQHVSLYCRYDDHKLGWLKSSRSEYIDIEARIKALQEGDKDVV